MKNGLDYMPITEVHEHLSTIKSSIDRLSVSVEHHEKILEKMHTILESQAVTAQKIETAIQSITELKKEVQASQNKNEHNFQRLTFRFMLICGVIIIIAYEAGIDVKALLSFL